MTEREWLASDDPQRMLRLLGGEVTWRASEPKPVIAPVSDRKMRLFAVAVSRLQPTLTTASIQALECAEELADGRHCDPPPLSKWIVLDPNATRAVFGVLGWISSLHVAIREPICPKLPALLRTIVGNPFRPVSLCGNRDHGSVVVRPYCPACRRILDHTNGTVPKLAQVIYDERRWELMPMLADALEEAGVRDEEMLRWCRGEERCPTCCRGYQGWGGDGLQADADCLPCRGAGWIPRRSESVRGDWCIDLLLGKE